MGETWYLREVLLCVVEVKSLSLKEHFLLTNSDSDTCTLHKITHTAPMPKHTWKICPHVVFWKLILFTALNLLSHAHIKPCQLVQKYRGKAFKQMAVV